MDLNSMAILAVIAVVGVAALVFLIIRGGGQGGG
jgi:hypothetical protein